MKKIVSVFLSFIIVTTSTFITSYAAQSGTVQNKIDDKLLELYKSGSETLQVIIWFSDISHDGPICEALDAIGMSGDEFGEYCNGDTDSDIINKYITTKRKAHEKAYTDYNSRLAKELFSAEDVVYISLYSPIVIANLTYEKIQYPNESAPRTWTNVGNSNFDIYEFTPTVTGTYTVRITRTDNSSNVGTRIPYALAWR